MLRNLSRGEIYYVNFPYTLDERYPNGKEKFVLILQEGEYFDQYDTVEVLLITSDKTYKNHDQYVTDVEIPIGTTQLSRKSWICCSQPYPIEKKLFDNNGVWCAGKLSDEKMDEVDEALYLGLCQGIQNEKEDETNLRYLIGHSI